VYKIANPNAKPIWHASERANIVVTRARVGGYLIDRFANVSRLCRPIRARIFPALRAIKICTRLCSYNANGAASFEREKRS
jgi:hypothetical protein